MEADCGLCRAELGRGRGHFPDAVLARAQGRCIRLHRDGELFDAKWVYISDAGKATHFSEISAPDDKIVALDAFRLRNGERGVASR